MADRAIDMIVQMIRDRAVAGDGMSIDERRINMDKNAELFPLPEGVAIEKVTIGAVPAEWHTQAGADTTSQPVLLYFHGGGYVQGSPLSHQHLTGKLALEAGCRVLSVHYRLAPEHPFPAALEDGLAAYRWLLDQGIAPSQIAMGGDSAGGGLVMATMLAARDADIAQPASAVLMSPWVDLTCDTPSYTTRADADPMITQSGIAEVAQMYHGPADPKEPLVSPVFANLSGLAPLCIQVGDAEVLLNDSTELAERAQAAGVDVSIEVWDDMVHVWPAFYPILPEGAQAIDKMSAFLKSKW